MMEYATLACVPDFNMTLVTFAEALDASADPATPVAHNVSRRIALIAGGGAVAELGRFSVHAWLTRDLLL